MIKHKAAAKCARGGRETKTTIRLAYGDRVASHVGKEDVRNPLFVIGNHLLDLAAGCRLTVDCCTRKLIYDCTNTYGFNDAFSNPLSIVHLIGYPLEVGVPYTITASWSEDFSGVMGF